LKTNSGNNSECPVKCTTERLSVNIGGTKNRFGGRQTSVNTDRCSSVWHGTVQAPIAQVMVGVVQEPDNSVL